MKRNGFFWGALVGSALGIAACNGDGDDSSVAPAPKIDAGPDAAAPGEDANLPIEAGGDATIPVEGADASPAIDAARGDAGTDGSPEASTRSYALFAGTDFTSAELAVVALNPDTVEGQLPLADQDSVAAASGGSGFVLERGIGDVIVLDPAQPWTAKTTIDINDSLDAAPYASNPHAVVLTTGTKAYVARYASNLVAIVDVGSGSVTGHLDLSAYVAPDDTDGLVDVTDAAYDPGSGRAYFLLQRINQFDYGQAPDYVAACLASRAEIVGVDVTSNSIVDLNGAAAGDAIDLLGDDPIALTPDFANARILVPDTGCYQASDAGADGGPSPRTGRGVESVALATATPSWLYQSHVLDRLSGLIFVDGTRAFVNQGSDWFAWNPTQTTLGGVVASFPEAPFYDGSGRIVGVSSATGLDGGTVWSVVALDVGTSQLSMIAENPFRSVVPAPGYGVSSALLR
jgi:hypothetical protein